MNRREGRRQHRTRDGQTDRSRHLCQLSTCSMAVDIFHGTTSSSSRLHWTRAWTERKKEGEKKRERKNVNSAVNTGWNTLDDWNELKSTAILC